MKLLKQIKVEDIKDIAKVDIRLAVRAVLQDDDGMVPLLYVGKHKYHKLPGGGIEEEESEISALRRECMEEVGARVDTKHEVGAVEEFREKHNLKQISYCYYGEIIEKGEPSFTEKELSDGFEIVWMTYEKALKAIEKDKPTDYSGKFIQERDYELLKAAGKFMAPSWG